ncbi:lamin tail domain-containing protein [Candidatus Giovannonibacteria bacterium]|nr:lamin tail domain-containing protein [Candidatus Giovannonibacteria bacterium]
MKIRVTTLLLLSFFSPLFSFAYSDQTTHPALTDEIVDLFNLYYPELSLTTEEKEWVKIGSIIEDENIRPMNHFYDPVYDRGLWGFPASKIWAESTFRQSLYDPSYAISGSSLAAVSMGYFDSRTDYSWQRAVHDYVWTDKERGFIALGNILHLVEDASVPDHTRNDPHPPVLDFGSPYEYWTKKFTPTEIEGLAKSLYGDSAQPLAFGTLQDYFDSLSRYSNSNFFSKDTILFTDYVKPKISNEVEIIRSNGKSVIFAYNNDIILAARLAKFEWQSPEKKDYFLDDPDNLILTDYWSHLSKQAVLHGAGVMRLFFEEAEKERKSKELWAKGIPLSEKIYSAVAGTFGAEQAEPTPLIDEIPASAFQISLPRNDTVAEAAPSFSLPGENNSISPPLEDCLPAGRECARGGTEGEVLGEFTSNEIVPTPAPVPTSIPYVPGFGGGTPTMTLEQAAPSSDLPGSSTLGVEPLETPSVFPPGQPAGLTNDVTPPDISFSILECADSISFESCLLNPGSFTLAWNSDTADLEYYDISCMNGGLYCSGFDFLNTHATSTVFAAEDNRIYSFSAKAVDTTGNESPPLSKTVEVSASPVVINEVAWMGTPSDPSDEWMELYNRTSLPIDLSGWVLKAEDGVPYLPLSGVLPAHGYFLIERSNDETVSDIPADLILPFSGPPAGGAAGSGLSNSGEVLILSRGSTTIDRVPLCEGRWCGGSSFGSGYSMERRDADISSSDPYNWGSADSTVVTRGHDKNGLFLSATPKNRNSLNYIIAPGSVLESDKTLIFGRSPYIIPRNINFTVKPSVVLNIEPGVVIKFGSDALLNIEGTLKAEGTGEKPIVFTSIFDDEFGGDTNGDATTTEPSPGAWKNVLLVGPASQNVISHSRFRYGGRWYGNTPNNFRSMVAVESSPAEITHSIFEKSWSDGLKVSGSDADISDNLFSENSTIYQSGLTIGGGTPNISRNIFSGNYYGLNVQSSDASVSDNEFIGNISDAVTSNGRIGIFSGNGGSSNGINGISLSGSLTSSSGTTTLSANPLPYIIPSRTTLSVPQNFGLVIESGTKILGAGDSSSLEINGTLEMKGVSADDILFSSLGDSAPGQWKGIVMNSGSAAYGAGFTLRHGGGGPAACNNQCAGFSVNGGTLNLNQGKIEKNYNIGMRIDGGSNISLANFEFSEHTSAPGGGPGTGLMILNSNASLDGILFSSNSLAILTANSTLNVLNLTFENNIAISSPPNLF